METKISYEPMPYEIQEMKDLIDPFGRETFLKQRRFTKYLKKAEQNILEYVNAYLDKATNVYAESISDLVGWIICRSYSTKKDNIHGIDLFEIVKKPVISPYNGTKLEEKMHQAVLVQYEEERLFIKGEDFIWNEYSIVMEDFLYGKKAASEMEITENNYLTQALPEKPFEIMGILKRVVSRVYADMYIHYPYLEHLHSGLSAEFMKSTSEQIDDCLKQITQAKKESEEKDKQIQKLKDERNKDREEQERRSNKHHKALEQERWDFRSKYNKLASKYNALLERYQAAIQNDEELKDEPIPEPEPPEVDMNGKYAFVMEPSLKICSTLQENFPNAIFVEAEKKLGDIDCVIAMTNLMPHQGYKSLKEQCKNRGIPFRHCPNTNINMIKELIAKAMS